MMKTQIQMVGTNCSNCVHFFLLKKIFAESTQEVLNVNCSMMLTLNDNNVIVFVFVKDE